MARTGFYSVDAYIEAQPETARAALEQVRRAILRVLPDADETISYNMPAIQVRGAVILYFAGWKQHYSLYPVSAAVLAECGAEAGRYKAEKGTIRFPLTEPVPVRLIERIARIRAAEAAEREKKPKTKKSPTKSSAKRSVRDQAPQG
jgi:uncharacterized protein YdhG (YjbR/CyaY superfamily)